MPTTRGRPTVDKIAASIRRWGWTMPVLVDENGVVIAGHARLEAAAKLKLTRQVEQFRRIGADLVAELA